MGRNGVYRITSFSFLRSTLAALAFTTVGIVGSEKGSLALGMSQQYVLPAPVLPLANYSRTREWRTMVSLPCISLLV